MSKKFFLSIALLMLVLVLALSGCGSKEEPQATGTTGNGEPSTIKAFHPDQRAPIYPEFPADTYKMLSVASNASSIQPYYLFDGGILSEEVKDAKFALLYDAVHQKVLPNYYNGYYDFGITSFSGQVENWSGKVICSPERWTVGDRYVVIAGADLSPKQQLMVAPDVNSLKDLDGETIAMTNPKFDAEMLVNKALEKEGLKTKNAGGTVNVIYDYASNTVNAKALKEKNIKGAVVFDSYIFLLKKAGWKEINVANDTTRFVLVVRRDILEKKPDLVKQVLRAHIKATQLAKTDKAYVQPMMDKYNKEFLPSIGSPPRPPAAFRWDTVNSSWDPNIKNIKETYDYMKSNNLFTKPVKFEDVVDLTLLNEVLAEMKLAPVAAN